MRQLSVSQTFTLETLILDDLGLMHVIVYVSPNGTQMTVQNVRQQTSSYTFLVRRCRSSDFLICTVWN